MTYPDDVLAAAEKEFSVLWTPGMTTAERRLFLAKVLAAAEAAMPKPPLALGSGPGWSYSTGYSGRGLGDKVPVLVSETAAYHLPDGSGYFEWNEKRGGYDWMPTPPAAPRAIDSLTGQR